MNYNASETFTYYFISLNKTQMISLLPRYYGLSLLRTINLPPEGVRNVLGNTLVFTPQKF